MGALYLDLLGDRVVVRFDIPSIREGILEAVPLLERPPFDESADLHYTFRDLTGGPPLPDFNDYEEVAVSAGKDFSIFRRGDERWVVVEGRSAARFDFANGLVHAFVHEDHIRNGWIIGHRLFFLPLLEWMRERGRYPLHGSCFLVDGIGIVVSGSSGSGKSTALLAAIAAGCPFLADDTLFVSRKEDQIVLDPFPEPIKVGEGALRFFPEWEGKLVLKGGKYLLGEELLPSPGRVAGVRPSVLLFPEICADEKSRFDPISSHEASVHLLPQSILPTDRGRMEEHITILEQLVQQSRSFRFLSGSDIRELPAQVKELLSGAG